MKPIIKQTLAFLVMLMATIQTFGYDFKLDGIYYNITSKEDRTVEVTYYSYVGSDNKYAYDGAISIPQKLIYSNKTYTVTAIGERAFVRCYLTSIDIPNSVTSIGQYAFYGCGSLTSIDIPNSVTSIGRYAFYDCSSLTSIDIPNPVPSIGDYAFYGCSSLTSIDIPNSVTSIGDYAFYDCSSLTSIDIPNSVTSIGRYAFVYCSSLTSIDIPNSVTSIDNSTFSNCTGLTSIDIPNSVTSIGNSAFFGCSSLTSIDIPNSVKETRKIVTTKEKLNNLLDCLKKRNNQIFTRIDGHRYLDKNGNQRYCMDKLYIRGSDIEELLKILAS